MTSQKTQRGASRYSRNRYELQREQQESISLNLSKPLSLNLPLLQSHEPLNLLIDQSADSGSHQNADQFDQQQIQNIKTVKSKRIKKTKKQFSKGKKKMNQNRNQHKKVNRYIIKKVQELQCGKNLTEYYSQWYNTVSYMKKQYNLSPQLFENKSGLVYIVSYIKKLPIGNQNNVVRNLEEGYRRDCEQNRIKGIQKSNMRQLYETSISLVTNAFRNPYSVQQFCGELITNAGYRKKLLLANSLFERYLEEQFNFVLIDSNNAENTILEIQDIFGGQLEHLQNQQFSVEEYFMENDEKEKNLNEEK